MKYFNQQKNWGVLLIVVLLGGVAGIACAAPETSKPTAQATKPPEAEKAAPSAAEIDQLIKQLGDKDYFVRRKAQDALSRMGFEAFDALNAATLSEDLEISSRAKYLLRLMRVEWTVPSDPPEVKKFLQNYEYETAPVRERRMRALADLPNGLGVNALCRLARFEKSTIYSKMAAVTLLRSLKPGAPVPPNTIETIRKTLQGCNRAGANWLLAWTRLVAAPEAEIGQWSAIIDREARQLKQQQNESSPDIVFGLTRFQVAWLKKLERQADVAAAVNRQVEAESGDVETLGPTLEWLVDEKAWKGVDELQKRFGPRLASQPGLLYVLAEAYAQQGKKEISDRMADRALKMNGGKQPEQLVRHLQVALGLRNRGLFTWARREMEYILNQDKAKIGQYSVMTSSSLAEMLHDQGLEGDAAAAMEPIVKALDSGKLNEAELYNRRSEEVRSRALYFRACEAAQKNDAKKQREYLDKALETEPTDVDVLIACYRLPGQSAEYRTKIIDLIKKAAAKLREEIATDPDDPTNYNQLAWLIGNTEGDFDEAIRSSQKSLELQPNEGGYYDTLAHVYAGKGDWENAIKYQLKAEELDPHSGLIKKELAMFRKKLDEAKKK